MEIRERAEEWAREILVGHGSVGYRTELIKERLRRQKRLQRQLFQATFRIWEPAGLAEVDVESQAGAPIEIRYPVAAVDAEPVGLWPQRLDPWIPATLAEVAKAYPGSEVGVRELWRARAARGQERAILNAEHAAPDGVLKVEIDPQTGARIGFLCLPFYRGSKRSGAITRTTAVQRARASLDLPPGTRLAYSRLITRALGRLWRLRWEIRGAGMTGWIKVALNARTGRICELSRAVYPVPCLSDEERAPRGEASTQVRLAAVLRFGQQVEVGQLMEGAVTVGKETVPGWLAVVSGEGGTFRVTQARGQVRFQDRSRKRPRRPPSARAS